MNKLHNITSSALVLLSALVISGSVAAPNIKGRAKPMLQVTGFDTSYNSDGYSPDQIKKVYGIDKIKGTGKGQTIAIVDAYGDPDILDDIDVFDKQFNLNKADLTVATPYQLAPNGDPGWALETALDVEWAHAIAPDAKLLLVNAASANGIDLIDAVNYAVKKGASVVSMSWGIDEDNDETYIDSFLNRNGVLFVASSGDDGLGTCWPAASPKVISVGGTRLDIDSAGNRSSETVWSGSGGGLSTVENEPMWQRLFGVRSRGARAVPDVSFLADPKTGVAVYCSTDINGKSGWRVIGGTSVGAPSWSALIADINQDKRIISSPASLYQIAGNGAFYDITSGSNGSDASKGYDLATGLGSPQADKIVE